MSNKLLSSGVLLAATALALAAGLSEGRAADLDSVYGGLEPIAEQKVEYGTGWYVRGDLGGARGIQTRTLDDPYNGIYDGPGQAPPTLAASGSSRFLYDASLGAGYQFSRWVRADVTADFHQPLASSFHGASRACVTGETGVPPAPYLTETPVTASCTPTLNASLKSYGALVNGYVDLGTWSIVTPYVGAGIGLSFGHASSSATYIQNNGVPYKVTYTDALNGSSYYQNWDRSTGVQYYNVAFALMAGLSFDVFDHTKLDIGYRYLHLGQVLGTDLSYNEVRAGLRYMIDN